MSDMESDCDDVFTDDSKGCSFNEESKSSVSSQGDADLLVNRKKRRGIIEKRRRDRINNCLSELRRLVPAAFEKQGSAKLEKAEILQMTVEHLRNIYSKGGFDSSGLVVTDYHNIGFRECASEVARYLVGFEGLDIQDPLRLRLISHLQCFSTQRNLNTTSNQLSSPIRVAWWHDGLSQRQDKSVFSTDSYSNISCVITSFKKSTLSSEHKMQKDLATLYRPWVKGMEYFA